MSNYKAYFSAESLIKKINSLSGGGYCELIKKALTLYVLLIDGEVPASVKLLIIASLGYFICPVDVIPDVLPVVGYSDDLSIIATLLSQLESFVSLKVKSEVQSLMPDGCC